MRKRVSIKLTWEITPQDDLENPIVDGRDPMGVRKGAVNEETFADDAERVEDDECVIPIPRSKTLVLSSSAYDIIFVIDFLD